jgi:hypothetical protein
MWTQLAVSNLVELGLHRPSPADSGSLSQTRSFGFSLPPHQPRTLEERRSALAVFITSSTCVSFPVPQSSLGVGIRDRSRRKES